MKKFKITHIETGLYDIWEEENLEVVRRILANGNRNIMPIRSNNFFPLTLQNTTVKAL